MWHTAKGQPACARSAVSWPRHLDIQELVIHPSIIQTWNDVSLVTELFLCLSK